MIHRPAVPPRVRDALVALEQRLRAHFGAGLIDIRLFGSFARGEAHEESDVDVFVLLRKMTFADKRDVLNLAADVSLESDLTVSPTVFGVDRYREWLRQERPLIMDIERQGIPL
jgi:predicted nucleotidyltransferase